MPSTPLAMVCLSSPLLPRRKKPKLQGWPDAATTDEAQINAWFNQGPDANFAILANEKVCFIDTDPRNGAVETLARLEAEEPEFDLLLKTPDRRNRTRKTEAGTSTSSPPKGWRLP